HTRDGNTQSAVVLKSRSSVIAVIGSLVVIILLLLGSISSFGPREPKVLQSGNSPHLAMITQAVGAYDSDGGSIRSGENVESGKLSVDRGVVRLDFVNGARLAVEGPAEIEVVDAMRVVLLSGIITATIPDSAIGFVVDTDTAHVVDLGTAFGVSIGGDGITNVCVFEGEVKVSSPEYRQREERAHLLRVKEGEAIRVGGKLNTIDPIVYDTSVFKNAWPVNSGVLQTTGSMCFVAPGPDFHPGSYEDNEHIVVFPERRGFVSNETIRVDMVDPGQYAKVRYEEKPILLTKQRLTSYLLQLNAHPEGKNPNRRRSVRGQITFTKPIVGVIMANRLLKESEIVFGLPGVEYPGPRMIEPRPVGDRRPGFDSVILAADRRTLIIELQENPSDLDQFRVLVEAE
ncbi:MAG: hypothetical protein ABGW78_09645, partial [Pirellulales bacterium]